MSQYERVAWKAFVFSAAFALMATLTPGHAAGVVLGFFSGFFAAVCYGCLAANPDPEE